LAYFWLAGAPTCTVELILGNSNTTVTSYFRFFRELVSFNIGEQRGQIGGPGIVVEIDESKFGKRRYNRGHRVEGAWVFGGIERTQERRVFAMVVPNRTAETLLEAIRENIHPESIILSDMWRGYARIEEELDIEHQVVNHSRNFVDPVTGVHTNTIEGMWNGFKIAIPIRNRTAGFLDECLAEVIWRRNNKDNLWDGFLACLKDTAY
jgi:transposase-like protein